MPFDATGLKHVALLEVLIEGRRRVETSWFRLDPGESIPIDGHCAVFAISRQNVGDTLTVAALEYLGRAIDSLGSVGLRAWNDAPERTKDEVLAAYDIAYQLAIAG